MITIERFDGRLNKSQLALLSRADPNEQAIAEYIQNAAVFVAKNGDTTAGIVVVTTQSSQCELKNIAVLPAFEGQGIATKLVEVAKRHASKSGFTKLLVGTGNSSIQQLGFYQKRGFRITSVCTDYFAHYEPPIYENGIRCIDMIMLTADLTSL